MEQIHAIEIIVNELLQGLGTWLIAPMRAITTIGNEEFFVLLLPVIYWCFDQVVGLHVGITLLLGSTFNTFFKFLFHTPRPYWISDTVWAYSHESSFGLPSGHAQIAASVWGWLAVEVKKRWFTIAMVVLIFLIGLTRLYLGVHFLTDVLLGWILGGLLVWGFAASLTKFGPWLQRQTYRAKLRLVLASTVAILFLILGARWVVGPWVLHVEWAARAGEVDPFSLDGAFTLAGTWIGMLGGYVYLIENRGPFLADEGGWRRMVRFFIGLIGIIILYFGLGQVFPRGPTVTGFSLRFVRFGLIGLWVSWWGPVVFEKLGILRFSASNQVE